MANLVSRLRQPDADSERFGFQWYADQWMQLTGGGSFPAGLSQTWDRPGEEAAPVTYEQYAMSLFSADPVVFAAVVTRLAVFSQAKLQWRRQSTGELFGDQRLRKFERPWPGGTTSDLLGKMLMRADLGGNSYVWDSGPRLHVWRPDWVSLVIGSDVDADNPNQAEDAEVIAYLYWPGGDKTGKPRVYLPSEVAHFAPIEDPLANFRGMSWLTPVIREVQADKAATEHKWQFFNNAATPNMIIKFDASLTREQVADFKELMDSEHTGIANAYRNLYLGGGADATPVGADFKQLDFKNTQGKGETRIAMAAGVHPTILGASEGLGGSSLNAGNYNQTKRLLSDVRLQHLWGNATATLEPLARPLAGVELAHDTRRIPFLQDDLKDTAEIQSKQSSAIATLVRDGFTADSVVAAIAADDWSLLVHTNMVSVQLQPPGSQSQENAVTVTDPQAAGRMLAQGWTRVQEEA